MTGPPEPCSCQTGLASLFHYPEQTFEGLQTEQYMLQLGLKEIKFVPRFTISVLGPIPVLAYYCVGIEPVQYTRWCTPHTAYQYQTSMVRYGTSHIIQLGMVWQTLVCKGVRKQKFATMTRNQAFKCRTKIS